MGQKVWCTRACQTCRDLDLLHEKEDKSVDLNETGKKKKKKRQDNWLPELNEKKDHT